MLVFSPRSPNSRRNLTNYCDHSFARLVAFSYIMYSSHALTGVLSSKFLQSEMN